MTTISSTGTRPASISFDSETQASKSPTTFPIPTSSLRKSSMTSTRFARDAFEP